MNATRFQPSKGPVLAPTISDCTCFNLRKAARAVTQAYDEALRPTGLRSTQFTLLSVIDAFGTVTITELADEAVMDRTTLTRNLRLLEAEGLVRVTAGEDARVREVTLAPAARRRMNEAGKYWLQAQARMAESMGEARVKHLLNELAGAVVAAHAG